MGCHCGYILTIKLFTFKQQAGGEWNLKVNKNTRKSCKICSKLTNKNTRTTSSIPNENTRKPPEGLQIY